MALRYLRAHRIIYFSIAGVTIGIMVIVITSSIMGGFSRDMRSRIRGMQSHLTLRTRAPDLYMTDYEDMVERIRVIPHVKGAAPRLEHAAWMGVGSIRIVVQVVGIVPELERNTGNLEKYFRDGGKTRFDFRYDGGTEPKLPGIVLGPYWRWPRVGLQSVINDTPPRFLTGDFEVVGQFRTGMTEYDTGMHKGLGGYGFVSLETMNDFLNLKVPAANSIAVELDDYEMHAGEARAMILAMVHSLHPCRSRELHAWGQCGLHEVRSWEEAKKPLLQAVSIEKAIMGIILFFIVVVAGFNIIAIYTLMVRAKTRPWARARAVSPRSSSSAARSAASSAARSASSRGSSSRTTSTRSPTSWSCSRACSTGRAWSTRRSPTAW
jgi:lipoprotein-releasing system permease protein